MKIRAYIRTDENNKIRFYKDFTTIDFMPEVGNLYFKEVIKEILPIRLDPEQDRDEVYDYDYFKIITTMNEEFDKENDIYDEMWCAVKKPTLMVELHFWNKGSGYSHSEIIAEVPEGYTAEQYVEENEEIVDDNCDSDAINVELRNNNGNVVSEYWFCPEVVEIIKDGNYDAAENTMDCELREQLHCELAPCSDKYFLNEYMKRHQEKFGEEFTI